jgi:hypothetical protein
MISPQARFSFNGAFIVKFSEIEQEKRRQNGANDGQKAFIGESRYFEVPYHTSLHRFS